MMNNVEKIVVLNSGGFDSVVMLHWIKDKNPNAEIYSIHFSYGQNNEKQEKRCADKVCSKLGIEGLNIKIPRFTWTSKDFYGNKFVDAERKELEYRNLVFLSYALSFADSIEASSIYSAILSSHLGYKDTSYTFCDRFDSICSLSGIEFFTPFIELDKSQLDNMVFKYGITKDEFFSCDTPIKGSPCGDCPDCKCIEDIYSRVRVDTPLKALYKSGWDKASKFFQGVFFNCMVDEARLYINNDCQLSCPHCYYGFSSMKGEALSVQEYKNVIDRCVEFGIKNFHFSGKEPLFDDTIFEYASHIKKNHPGCTYDVVTNGINVPKYASKLKETGFSRIFLSVDAVLKEGELRSYSPEKALKALNDVGIPFTVFIDLTSNGIEKLYSTLEVLYEEYKAKDIYVRVDIPLGNGKNLNMLSTTDLEKAFFIVYDFSLYATDVSFCFTIPSFYNRKLEGLKEDSELSRAVNLRKEYCNELITDNVQLHLEDYCCRYENQITITADGYVLGCASETSCANYDKVSAGNVRDEDILSIVRKGKTKICKINGDLKNFDRCTFIPY